LISVGRDARALAARSPFWEVADPGEVGVFSKAARDGGVSVRVRVPTRRDVIVGDVDRIVSEARRLV
jgi:hypothetical protein